MIKKLMMTILVAVVLLAAGYGGMVWDNNRTVTMSSRQQISDSREKSISWLMNNRQTILNNANPALWWMVGQSAEVSGDSRLQALYAEFVQDYDKNYSGSIWRSFFHPETVWGANIPHAAYEKFPPYQQYFLFSLTCSKNVGGNPIIVAQHDTGYCSANQPIIPACVTHQMMGFRLQQRIGCDRVTGLGDKIAVLQRTIEKQLTWDPRVVDVYLQRVLMLVDSGAAERVKPRWVQRILDAQLPDGSWSQLQPLVPLGGERYLGFNAKLAGVGPARPDFHATAQGLWLTSLLLQNADGTAQVSSAPAAE